MIADRKCCANMCSSSSSDLPREPAAISVIGISLPVLPCELAASSVIGIRLSVLPRELAIESSLRIYTLRSKPVGPTSPARSSQALPRQLSWSSHTGFSKLSFSGSWFLSGRAGAFCNAFSNLSFPVGSRQSWPPALPVRPSSSARVSACRASPDSSALPSRSVML